ncbi:hypothetical protein F511_36274 [Dorcoceras hygrometricum]|uniref:Uncharacterized protein n=1 Tax=Dorcoceras hygrometricum TaxID=472368 RepID=A0A2Z7B449_9LAMI|nr:hypothetical protein F511_36274 [Dorcoceras hygrometricum]
MTSLLMSSSLIPDPALLFTTADLYALALLLVFLHLLIVMTSLLMSSSLIPDPALLFTTADLYALALLLVFLHLLIMMSSPMTSSSMVHLDVPAGSLLMFQLVHLPLLALAAGSYRSS